MYSIIKYTVVYRDDNDFMCLKHFESTADLAKFVNEAIEELGFDPGDGNLSKELAEHILVFEGKHQPKPLKVKKVSELKISVGEEEGSSRTVGSVAREKIITNLKYEISDIKDALTQNVGADRRKELNAELSILQKRLQNLLYPPKQC